MLCVRGCVVLYILSGCVVMYILSEEVCCGMRAQRRKYCLDGGGYSFSLLQHRSVSASI